MNAEKVGGWTDSEFVILKGFGGGWKPTIID